MSQRTTPVIELEARDAASLSKVTIGLFGTDEEDLTKLGTVQRDVYVSVFDTNSGAESLYPATILQSGLLSASHPAAGGISFSPRRHAYRLGRRFPFLLPQGEVGAEVLAKAVYFVTLDLQDLDTSVVAEPVPPKTATWETVEDHLSPLLRRLDSNAKNILFRGREVRLRHPVRVDVQESRPMTLAERRALPESSLVTRRILRRKT